MITTMPFSCTRGSLTIRGDLLTAAPQERRPAVILSHGFMGHRKQCLDYARLLAEQGWAAVIFDFCGGGMEGESDGLTERMTVLTEVQDLLAVIDAVRALPQTDGQPVALLGCSQGGFVSALTAKRVPEAVCRLMLLYPALCIPDDARSGQMMFFRFDPANIPELLGEEPMRLGGCYARAVIGMDAMAEIAGWEKPVLLLHGDADAIVPVDYARRAKDCYPDCRYVEITGGEHGFRGTAEEEARREISRFMQLG